MSKPSSGEYLQDDIQYLRGQGCTHLVSLLEPQEASELDLRDEAQICANQGIKFSQVPIQDRSVPTDRKAFIYSVHVSYDALCKGGHLIAHCRAGIGRSGIYTTSILICHGLSVDEAFDLVSEARGLKIPDTPMQIEWIREHQNSIKTGA